MRIYNYRTPNINCDRPWKDCIFNDKSQLTSFKAKPLVAFNNQHVIQQHDITYITGKDACHAHHFAKMLATAVLYGEYQHAPSISVSTTDEPASILWIDTVRGPHACAAFFQEMTANLDNDDKRFHLLCLDMLGSIRENFWELTREVENYINILKPSLVVVDDIDHLMPHSGINVAAEFNKIVRDTINHTDTAFLFVGYNHLGKQAATTGEVGKLLFNSSNSIFSVSTRHAVSKVRLIRSYQILHNMLQDNGNEFCFSIADDNQAHEVVSAKCPSVSSSNDGQPQPLPDGFINQTILRDIISQVINPGESISPDELTAKLTARRQQLNRIDRSRNLIAQALHLGIIHKASDNSNAYTITPPTTPTRPTDKPCNLTLH